SDAKRVVGFDLCSGARGGTRLHDAHRSTGAGRGADHGLLLGLGVRRHQGGSGRAVARGARARPADRRLDRARHPRRAPAAGPALAPRPRADPRDRRALVRDLLPGAQRRRARGRRRDRGDAGQRGADPDRHPERPLPGRGVPAAAADWLPHRIRGRGGHLTGYVVAQPGGATLLGIALCFVSATVYSIAVTIQKPLLRRVNGLMATWLACSVGMLVSLPFLPELLDGARG